MNEINFAPGQDWGEVCQSIQDMCNEIDMVMCPDVDLIDKHFACYKDGNFTTEDFDKALNAAVVDQLRRTMGVLAEKGLVDYQVGDDGEFVFSLTQTGKQMSQILNNYS